VKTVVSFASSFFWLLPKHFSLSYSFIWFSLEFFLSKMSFRLLFFIFLQKNLDGHSSLLFVGDMLLLLMVQVQLQFPILKNVYKEGYFKFLRYNFIKLNVRMLHFYFLYLNVYCYCLQFHFMGYFRSLPTAVNKNWKNLSNKILLAKIRFI
jgi:hypothetical protein